MKKCSKCGKVKLLTFFHKLLKSNDGHRPDCKDCCKKQRDDKNKEDVVRHKSQILANGIMKRVKYSVDNPKNKCYKENNIKCTIGNTPKEIADYLYNNYYNEIKSLIDNGLTPSVDRIDSEGNYSPDNIRIIDLHDNIVDGVVNAIKKTSKVVVAIKGESAIIYNSISDASRALKIKRDTISVHLDKGTKTRSGYEFKTIKIKDDE